MLRNTSNKTRNFSTIDKSQNQTSGDTKRKIIEFLNSINWIHFVLLTVSPLIGIYGLFTVPIHPKTLLFSIFYFYTTAIGITAGYHRYWSHRSYDASTPMQILLSLMGAGAVQGSILWWSKDHRVHHRFTDTEKDPYSAPKGFWWSHLGWMIFKKDKKKIGRAEIDDLVKSKIVMWQHRNYPYIAFFMSIVFPTLVCYLFWNDLKGGYFYAGVLRMVGVHHSTFCVNSLAHWLGTSNYDDKHTPRDHFITAIVTAGEGYHNFHHQFPNDYRNAIRFYQYDPTKWFIYTFYLLGLAKNLKRFPENEIKKGNFNMRLKKLEEVRPTINWGVDVEKLPAVTFDEYVKMCKQEGKNLIVIEGVVYNLGRFVDEHPGGKKYIMSGVGTDATEPFNGVIYNHSNAARNLLHSMRFARIKK